MAVEIGQDVTDEETRRFGGTAFRHRNDEQRFVTLAVALVTIGQSHRLSGDAEISAFEPPVLENRRGGLPRDGSGNDDAETTNRGGCGDADQADDPPLHRNGPLQQSAVLVRQQLQTPRHGLVPRANGRIAARRKKVRNGALLVRQHGRSPWQIQRRQRSRRPGCDDDVDGKRRKLCPKRR